MSALSDFASGLGIATVRETLRWVKVTLALLSSTWALASDANSLGVAPPQKHSAAAAPSKSDTCSRRESGTVQLDAVARVDDGVRQPPTVANTAAGTISCWTSQRTNAEIMRRD